MSLRETAQSILLTSFFALVPITHGSAQTFSSDPTMISFDDKGDLAGTSKADLQELLHGTAPSDVFILAHGWNNSYSEAQDSYRNMIGLMKSVALNQSLLPTSYKSLIIGISWPSKAWDSEPGGRSLSLNQDDADVLTIYRVFPPGKNPANYESDVQLMQALLAKDKEKRTTEKDYSETQRLFLKYKITTNNSDDLANNSDDPDFFKLISEGRGLFDFNYSIRDGLRLFTYWQMKQRARIVGANGVRKMLEQLLSAFPKSRFHLFGHSFGAKLMLSCIGTSVQTSRPISSLFLIQGAVSYQAMSPVGGHANVPSRVSGPIVATYSDNDSVLGVPYEMASRLARQTAERSISKYSAMGRVGAEFGQSVTVVPVSQGGLSYRFAQGVFKVYGGPYIKGHSLFYNESIARMLWSGVLAPNSDGKTPLFGLGRTITTEEINTASVKASTLVKSMQKTLNEREMLRVYTNTIETILNKHVPSSPNPLALTIQSDFSKYAIFDIRRTQERSALEAKLMDDRFFELKSFKTSFQKWILDNDASDAAERVLGGICAKKDVVYKQCVAIGWRPKIPAGADYDWNGSGTLFDWDLVLTAGHVIPHGLRNASPETRKTSLDDYQFAVLIGNDVTSPMRIIVPVDVRIEHPSYDGPSFKNDIAILKLRRRVEPAELFSDGTTELPVSLPPADVWEKIDKKLVTLVGFGSCSPDGSPATFGMRRRAEKVLVAVPQNEDEAKLIGCFAGIEFAAGGQGIDTCKGDSGGPVVFKLNNKLYLVGTTSREARLQLSGGMPIPGRVPTSICGDGGIYCLVWRHMDNFIKPAIKQLRSANNK